MKEKLYTVEENSDAFLIKQDGVEIASFTRFTEAEEKEIAFTLAKGLCEGLNSPRETKSADCATKKLYTKAEAIIKIQSGEWKEAINTETNHFFITKEGDINLFYNNFASDSIINFCMDEKPMWKEHTPEAPFDKSSDEALVGIFNKGEIWERSGTELDYKPLVRRRALSGDCRYALDGSTTWKFAAWDEVDKASKWRKAKNQEVES